MKKFTLPVAILVIISLLFSACAKKEYTLTIAANGQGTTNPGTGTYTYVDGKSLTISATPSSGWKFDGWSGDATGNNAIISITMDGKKGITANFSKIPYTLTIAANGQGTTNPPAGARTYDAGTVVNITANPGTGWRFDSWSGDVAAPTSAITTVTMNSDKTVTANFSKASQDFGPYTFSISTGSGDWNISSIKMGDRVQFDFQAAGATVSYSVRDPNGNTILTGGGYVQFGGGSFVAATSGTYKLHFVSSEFSTLSVLRIRYIIYFAS